MVKLLVNRFQISVIVLITLLSTILSAQQTDYSTKWEMKHHQNEKSYRALRFDIGKVKIYEEDEEGEVFSIKYIRSVEQQNRLRIDVGIIFGNAAEGFQMGDIGVEWLVFPDAVISPFIAMGSGVIKDDIFYSLVYRGNFGIQLKGGSTSFRLTIQRGNQIGGLKAFNEGSNGPNLIMMGIEFGNISK